MARDNRTAHVIGLHLASAILGAAIGFAARDNLSMTAHAAILGTIGIVLLLSNVVVKDVQNGFSEQVKRAQDLRGAKRSQIVHYVRARRTEVYFAWMLGNVAGTLCAGFGAKNALDIVKNTEAAFVPVWMIVAGYAFAAAALPGLLRLVNYALKLDRFGEQVSEMLEQQKRLAGRMEALPKPDAFAALVAEKHPGRGW